MEIRPSFVQALRFWLLLGLISFGGPAGQIAIMYQELVEKRKWLSRDRFLHAMNYCMLLPGPEAIQLAIYSGWMLHGTRGGLAAGILFLLPSVLILWTLSYVYVAFGTVPWIVAIFYGLKPAVVAIVAAAFIRMSDKALSNSTMILLAVMAFVSLFFFNVPFPLVILSAIGIGWVGGTYFPAAFSPISTIPTSAVIHDTLGTPSEAQPNLKKTLNVLFWGLFLWWIPVIILGYLTGWDHILFKQALFFSKVAVITFGGAYAVLSYVAQYTVGSGWILPGQMIDGLGLAETTPGPLIMVLQFVGFVAGWNHPHSLTPLVSATLGALVATWTTFVPCFLWIFLGAPYIEKFRGNSHLNAALSAVTAAVAGVVLNLAVWFGIQVIYLQQGGFDPLAFLISAFAFIGLWKWNWQIVYVICGSGLIGILFQWLKGGL